MNNRIPKELEEKQERQRQSTIIIVLRAISELKAEGYTVRIKDLMDYTGLSRSVFGKKHVRDVLISQGIVSKKGCNSTYSIPKQSAEQRLKRILTDKEARIRQLIAENASLKNECEMLRGRLFLLMQKQNENK
jgi:hypothetical protein